MSATGFVEWCLELLQALGTVRARRMFGGHGVYVDGLFVALIADEVLYLKVDAGTRARFEEAGCRPFVYGGKGKPMTMSYWTVPDEAMESPATMAPWGRLALQAALAARALRAAKPARAPAAKRKSTAAKSRRPLR